MTTQEDRENEDQPNLCYTAVDWGAPSEVAYLTLLKGRDGLKSVK